MKATLIIADKKSVGTIESINAAIKGSETFWLDICIEETDKPQDLSFLETSFGFHRLAVEDVENFGQRPKIDIYDDHTLLVVHGAGGDKGTEEVHLFLSDKSIVTIHKGPLSCEDRVAKRYANHHGKEDPPTQVMVAYLIVDEMTDSFFPGLTDFDNRIDELENAILEQPTEEQLGDIFSMKRRLMGIRKVVTPQRDVIASVASGVMELPGMTDEAGRYFRDLYDHLIRISDTIDAYRDLLSGVMDTHISTVSNRLNVVMKQLAIIATVFLPLSFLTGFFGQNFAWLLNHIGGTWIFWLLGMGSEVVAVIILMVLFKRRGWLGGPSA